MVQLDSTENDVGFEGQEEEPADLESGGDNDNSGFDDDHSEDYGQQSLLQIYARDRQWLAKATEVVQDHSNYPLGHLTPEDVDKITELMGAWVKQRSVKAALSVDNLLKRVVDDMRANNHHVSVNAKMYSLAMGKFQGISTTRGGLE